MTLPPVGLLEFAQLVGRGRGTVWGWVKAGMPVQAPRGGRQGAHQIDVGAAVRWLLARVEAEADARSADKASPELVSARERRAVAEARVAELTVKKLEGAYIAVDDIEPVWARIVIATRERILSLPKDARQLALVDAGGEERLEQLVYDALTELSENAGKVGQPKANSTVRRRRGTR